MRDFWKMTAMMKRKTPMAVMMEMNLRTLLMRSRESGCVSVVLQ